MQPIRWAVIAAVLAISTSAWAQYKWIGPDGKVTYSDQPPPAEAKSLKPIAVQPGPAAGDEGASLPFALQQASRNWPVTVYLADKCAPCNAARAYLVNRGVPFAERSVNSNADIEALKQVTGDNRIPLMTVGTLTAKGFEPGEWDATLDAAGYPRTSQLPRNYKRPAAQPLVPPPVIKAPEPPAPPKVAEPEPSQPQQPPPEPGDAPPGFRF